MILDFDKAMWASGPESVFAPASYRDELERQAVAAVQAERKAIYDQWATAVTNFNAPNVIEFHNWLSGRLREAK